MFFNYRPSYRLKGDLRFIFAMPLFWLPAFGWAPDNSITFEVMKVSALIVGLLTLYVWIGRLETNSTRAWIYISILTLAMLLTTFIYFVRFLELLAYTFSLPTMLVAFWALVTILLSFVWMSSTYRAKREKLNILKQQRLLGRYKIFNEQEAQWRITEYYPGVDGSTPEEEGKKEQRNWGCISLIPISGITFYLIRTTQGSIAWILLCIFLGVYSLMLLGAVDHLATLLQLRQWENELGKPIYTDIEESKQSKEVE